MGAGWAGPYACIWTIAKRPPLPRRPKGQPMCEWNIRTLVNDIVLALVINTSATLLAGAPMAWGTWYPYTCVAFTTNVVAQLLIPTVSISQSLTKGLASKAARPYAAIFIENLDLRHHHLAHRGGDAGWARADARRMEPDLPAARSYRLRDLGRPLQDSLQARAGLAHNLTYNAKGKVERDHGTY